MRQSYGKLKKDWEGVSLSETLVVMTPGYEKAAWSGSFRVW